MPITVLKNNVPWGPFSRAQIKAGLDRGDFNLQYLAHVPGLREWLPLGEVLDHFDKAASIPPAAPPSTPPFDLASLPPVPTGRPTAPPIKRIDPPPVPFIPAQKTEPAVPPAFAQSPVNSPPVKHASPEPPPIAGPMEPAPFFTRFIAFALDCAVLFVPLLVLLGLGALTVEIGGLVEKNDSETMRQEWLLLWRNFRELLVLVVLGGAWLYAAGLECSRWQATVGKQWMRLRVTDRDGHRLSFFRATGRHLAKFLSALPIFLGFTAAMFSSRGLAWHDRLAGTRVLKK